MLQQLKPAKTKQTYYTREKIENARKNIERFEWARQMKEDAVAKADKYVQLGLEALWKAVTPQSLPRSTWVNKEDGSPVTGKQFIKDYGFHGWQADPLQLSWKLRDPSCGYLFPTNDFASYYESGLDIHGIFRRELADPRYLVNELYPAKGKDWGVDDGNGWIDEEGKKYAFVAYYNDQHIWGFGPGIVASGLAALTDAYLFTGDLRYAQAGIVLLDRVADVYPEMDSSVYKWEDGFYHSHGLTWKGKVFGCISECILLWTLLPAYDAFFDAFETADVVDFLHAKAVRYRLLNSKQYAAAIKLNIEKGLIRQVFPAVQNAQVRGNFGMHQRSLALAAVILDEEGTSEQWIDWLFQTGGLVHDSDYRLTGGNVLTTLVDDVDRDGAGNESSPGYNSLWIDQLKPMVDVLEHYDRYSKSNLYKHVKMKKMFDPFCPLTMVSRYTPTIGDFEKTGNPYILGNPSTYVDAFSKYGEAAYAQYAYFLNGNKLDGLHGDIFSSDNEQTLKDIDQVIKIHGPLKLGGNGTNLTGYGFAALRHSGDIPHEDESLLLDERERGLWVYYGRNFGHGHRDCLNLGLHAYDLDLLPDFGNPETKDGSAKTVEWFNNTVSHNTVVVDQSKQNNSWVGIPQHYHGEGRIQWIDVEAPNAYPNTSLYRRAAALVRIDDDSSYVIDFFRVKGGREHHYSFHAAEGEVRILEGLKLVKQPKGTYAGEHIQYAGYDGTKPEWYGRKREYTGSGFQYLTNVRRDSKPPEAFSVDWNVKDTWGIRAGLTGEIHLRLTMLGHWNDVSLCDGIPPQLPGNPNQLTYVIAHRSGEELESQFVSVIEPYKDNRLIASISRVCMKTGGKEYEGADAAAVKIVHVSGRCDYIAHSLREDVLYTIDDKITFCGSLAVYSEMDGKPFYGFISDGTLLDSLGVRLISLTEGSLQGQVLDFTKEVSLENTILVKLDHGLANAVELAGKWIYVDNDGVRNAVYPIKNVRVLEDGTAELDIGDITLIRQYMDKHDYSKGYIYDISEGCRFRIPLTGEWSEI